MRLGIRFKAEHFTIPVNNNSIIQGFLYRCLGEEPAYSDFLHNRGYRSEPGKNFKAFTFSKLRGRHKYDALTKSMIFENQILLFVSSLDLHFCNILIKVLYTKEQLTINGQEVQVEEIWVDDTHVSDSSIQIRMLSPIMIHTRLASGKTRYFSPEDEGWEELLQDNFFRKYAAIIGREPVCSIEITPIRVSDKDKVVTRYKGQLLMTGYTGEYLLNGPVLYLDFLYQVGLGSNNSQGFGMFEMTDYDA